VQKIEDFAQKLVENAKEKKKSDDLLPYPQKSRTFAAEFHT
jgi:hypothetical protein